VDGEVAAEEVEGEVGRVVLGVCREEHSRPEVLEGVCGGGLDGGGRVNSDPVGASDVLALLEVVVPPGFAVLGEGEKVVGLDESVA
jgi:hypothetical protein